jgi:NTE family protein
MYGTSIGSLLLVIIALKYDWDTLDDYLIKRPWQTVYKFDMYSLLHSIQKRGIFNIKEIEDTLLPLFKGKDISIDITMKEFYEFTNIELHIFTTEINSFQMLDISYKTHPDWKVSEAVYCSSALPIAFAPHLKDNHCYCDGGIFMNYPIHTCIENGAHVDEILGITRIPDKDSVVHIKHESSLLDYIMAIMIKSMERLLIHNTTPYIKHEFVMESPSISIYELLNAASNMEQRIQLIEEGANHTKRILSEKSPFSNSTT